MIILYDYRLTLSYIYPIAEDYLSIILFNLNLQSVACAAPILLALLVYKVILVFYCL